MQRTHTALQLLDQVLLVAAVIRLTNDLLCREVSVVRHVEEVPKVRAEGALALFFHDELAQHDDPIRSLGLSRLVLELREVLGEEPLVQEAAFSDDLFLDPRLLGARLLVEGVRSLANQLMVLGFLEVQGLRTLIEIT